MDGSIKFRMLEFTLFINRNEVIDFAIIVSAGFGKVSKTNKDDLRKTE